MAASEEPGGSVICGCSLACTVLIVPLDKAAEERVTKAADRAQTIRSQMAQAGASGDEEPPHPTGEATRTRSTSYDIAGQEEPGSGGGNLGAVFKFGLPFWLIAFGCVVVYGE